MPDIRTELLADYSKENTLRVVKLIGSDPVLVRELMEIFFEDQSHVNKMAAWSAEHCYEAHPSIFKPYHKRMVEHLKIPVLHQAFKRVILKIMMDSDIPKEMFDDLFEICYTFFTSQKETVSVRVMSMQVLFNISLKIPELQNEIALIIEDQLPYGTPGFKNRGTKILNQIRKMNLRA